MIQNAIYNSLIFFFYYNDSKIKCLHIGTIQVPTPESWDTRNFFFKKKLKLNQVIVLDNNLFKKKLLKLAGLNRI